MMDRSSSQKLRRVPQRGLAVRLFNIAGISRGTLLTDVAEPPRNLATARSGDGNDAARKSGGESHGP